MIGRRLFDLTDGWHGRPAVGDHVFVVTHEAPTDWPHPDAPFTFVTDGLGSAIEQARTFAGDREVWLTAGDLTGQALAAGLVDEVEMALVPVGSARACGSSASLPRGPSSSRTRMSWCTATAWCTCATASGRVELSGCRSPSPALTAGLGSPGGERPPLPDCGQPGSTALAGPEDGWECRNECRRLPIPVPLN